jgi:hypothetical protein
MNEGWYNDEYLVIFSQAESNRAAEKYKLAQYLPGHTLVGLRNWDDFIVVSQAGGMCSLPTVPIDLARSESFTLSASVALELDARLTGKIKWYVKPLVFGGEPNDKENVSWVTLEQHAGLVVWWNEQYKKLRAQAAGA